MPRSGSRRGVPDTMWFAPTSRPTFFWDLPGNLTAQLRPNGCLILAGILGSEFERVQSAYAEVGWRLTRTKAVGEWQSGSFVAI